MGLGWDEENGCMYVCMYVCMYLFINVWEGVVFV